MTYISKQQKLKLLSTLIFSLTLIGSIFYYFQNSGNIPGGQIAFAKIFWLGFIIFFWFFAPTLLLLDGAYEKFDRWLLIIHLINVWSRAVIELIMMYSLGNWHPTYGINHDLCSAFLMGLVMIVLYKKLSKFIALFMTVICITFVIEAYFAQYMLSNVIDSNNRVFFVPDSTKHHSIITLTWWVLLFLSLYGAYFMQKWYTLEHD